MNTISIAAITPSPTNPRKTFDAPKLAELTESVQRHGVLQPILVRPVGGELTVNGFTFELVAGERRFRAAQAAGLKEIPATVRELTDTEVLEIQVIENLQREDLSPLEEAEGYAALMKCAHLDGKPYTVEEIAAKIGKSKGYVYARLKLGELCEAGRAALAEGKISAAVAELIARIPGEAQQAKAVEDVSDRWGAPMSLREAREHIHRTFMLQLDRAPFDTKAIYFVKAGSVETLPTCGECPKRTGNQPELFSDVKAKDTCTDPDCFDAKTRAAVLVKVEALRAAGRQVISGKEAKKILPQSYSEPKGYVKLDAYCHDDDKGRHWRAVLGKACPEPVLLENPHRAGDFIEIVPAKVARELMVKKYPEIAKREKENEAAIRKTQRANEIGTETDWRVYLALRERVGREGFTNAELREIVLERLDAYDVDLDPRLHPHWGFAEGEDFDSVNDKVNAATGGALLQMVLDVVLPNGCEAIDRLAKLHDIDVKAIERQVKADLKVRTKEQPAEEVEAE